MKYFAVAVIFGLFALSQAMPVEETKEKRFINNFLITQAVNLAKDACNGIQGSGNPVDPLISKACDCLNAVTGITGIFGDESNLEQKRFIFNLGSLINQVQNVIDGVCANAPPQFADLCQCIKF